MTAIAVLGSTHMDLVAYVARAPERGETVTGRELRTVPGGKGANQAVAAARAGADVTMIGAVGDDAYGTLLRSSLEHAGCPHRSAAHGRGPQWHRAHRRRRHGRQIRRGDPRRQRHRHRPRPRRNGRHRRSRSAAPPAGAATVRRAGGRASRPRPGRTDHPHPVPRTAPAVRTLRLCRCADPQRARGSRALRLRGPRAAAQILLGQVPAVVITLGSKGCLYAARGGEPVLFPAPEVTAVDTTGAGDTFVGTLAVALGERRPVPESLAWASSAAALCVQRPGASTSMPYRSEIDAA